VKSRAKQTQFDGFSSQGQRGFGGSLSRLRRQRVARPISTKHSMHLILKSSIAKGAFSLRVNGNKQKIDAVISNSCTKYGVRLIRSSNNLKFGSRELYKRFVRAISGSIAMLVTGANKTRSIATISGRKQFWDYRPFSRIAIGRRGFKVVDDYVRLNQLEADGLMPKREGRLKSLTADDLAFFER
jgi:hypothetical protein